MSWRATRLRPGTSGSGSIVCASSPSTRVTVSLRASLDDMHAEYTSFGRGSAHERPAQARPATGAPRGPRPRSARLAGRPFLASARRRGGEARLRERLRLDCDRLAPERRCAHVDALALQPLQAVVVDGEDRLGLALALALE